MYDSVLTLITKTYPAESTDEYGNLVQPEQSTHNVYAEVKSVGYREFYEAAAKGFKPEIKFVLPHKQDYNNEMQLTYNGVNYDVIRTYAPEFGDTLEIICGKGIT